MQLIFFETLLWLKPYLSCSESSAVSLYNHALLSQTSCEIIPVTSLLHCFDLFIFQFQELLLCSLTVRMFGEEFFRGSEQTSICPRPCIHQVCKGVLRFEEKVSCFRHGCQLVDKRIFLTLQLLKQRRCNKSFKSGRWRHFAMERPAVWFPEIF